MKCEIVIVRLNLFLKRFLESSQRQLFIEVGWTLSLEQNLFCQPGPSNFKPNMQISLFHSSRSASIFFSEDKKRCLYFHIVQQKRCTSFFTMNSTRRLGSSTSLINMWDGRFPRNYERRFFSGIWVNVSCLGETAGRLMTARKDRHD